MRKVGTYKALGSSSHFTPNPLPPESPPLEITPEIQKLSEKALFMLGQLNAIGQSIPSAQRFIKSYIIKEALLSSCVENIHATLQDVFTQPFESNKTSKETQLVVNYYDALSAALDILKTQNLLLVSKVFLRAHQVLMESGGAASASPGSYRKQSVRVGNLIPPMAQDIPGLISDLEKFINEPSGISPLIKAGLAHVQFETIHPFLDGNGRIGRLIIILMIMQDGLLSAPILYPSYYFKLHQAEYYQLLDRVRKHGDFEAWTLFYLKAIYFSAVDAYDRAKEIDILHAQLTQKIMDLDAYAKAKEMALSALQYLFLSPVTNVSSLAKHLGKSYNTAQKTIELLQGENILQEVTSRKRNKLYKFHPYLQLLEKDFVQNV